ncbi:MAG: hypothetical protein LBS99_06950 [Clostridiales bacterium]|nr:hypothetical protein [Clostridiales bacterium]
MTKRSKFIARYGVIAALVAVSVFMDMAISKIMLPILPVEAVIVTTLTVMTMCQLFDYKTAVFTTTLLGTVSFIIAFVLPVGIPGASGEPIFPFQNPLVSLLPRILIGLGCYPTFIGLKKLFKNNKSAFVREILPRSLGAAAGTLINTVGVLGMIAVFYESTVILTILTVVLAFNFAAEFIVSLILTPIISFRVSKRTTVNEGIAVVNTPAADIWTDAAARNDGEDK